MVDRSVADIFDEWSNRRRGILRALTTEVDEFVARCPPHREGLCLFGNLDGSWHVGPPSFEVPPVVPEPCNGINCARDSLDVLLHPLLNSLHGLKVVHRDCHGLPSFVLMQKAGLSTVIDCNAVTAGDQGGIIVTSSQDINNRLGETSYEGQESQETTPMPQLETTEDGELWKDGDGDPCPLCHQHYKQGNFWICCDYCERWYCGKCVKLDETKAARFSKWKCPLCQA